MRYGMLTTLCALVVTACASTGETATGGSRNVITSEQLRDLQGVSTAYEAVQRLRPRFLQGRAGTRSTASAGQPLSRASSSGEASPVTVYLDGARAGGIEVLHRVPVDSVHEIRYVNGRDATTKYGTNHGGGVIEVITG